MKTLEGKFKTGRIYDFEQEIEYSAKQVSDFPEEYLVRFKDKSRHIEGTMLLLSSKYALQKEILSAYDNGDYN